MAIDDIFGETRPVLLPTKSALYVWGYNQSGQTGRRCEEQNLRIPKQLPPELSGVQLERIHAGWIWLVAVSILQPWPLMGLYLPGMQMENIRPNQDMGAPQPWGPPQNFPMNAGGGHGFRPNQFMPPQHQFDNFYPRVDMAPPMDKPGLYENFIADAATADAQNQAAPPPSSQGYNPYPGQVPSYPAQPAPPGHAHAAGDYSNPVYGGNYGY